MENWSIGKNENRCKSITPTLQYSMSLFLQLPGKLHKSHILPQKVVKMNRGMDTKPTPIITLKTIPTLLIKGMYLG